MTDSLELAHEHHGWGRMNRGIIFLPDKKRPDARTGFDIKDELLWESLFHLVAFLAESGESVRFVKEEE